MKKNTGKKRTHQYQFGKLTAFVMTLILFAQMIQPAGSLLSRASDEAGQSLDLLRVDNSPINRELFDMANLTVDRNGDVVRFDLAFTVHEDKESGQDETETATAETLTQETLTEETLTQETLTEETLTQETLTEETLTQETFTEETLTQETYTEDTAVGETSVEGSDTESTSAAETSSVAATDETKKNDMSESAGSETAPEENSSQETAAADTASYTNEEAAQPEIEAVNRTEVDSPVHYASADTIHDQTEVGRIEKEELTFDLEFAQPFIMGGGTQGEVYRVSSDMDIDSETIGSFRIEENEDNSRVKVKISILVPAYRDQVKGEVQFELGITGEMEELLIRWDADERAVVGQEGKEEEEENPPLVFKRAALSGKIRSVPAQTIPGESVELPVIDLVEYLKKTDAECAKMFASATLKLTTTRGSSKVGVRVDGVLSENYLQTGLETVMSDMPSDITDVGAYLADISNYEKLPDLRLPVEFGDTFRTIGGQTIDNNLYIGEDIVEANKAGNYELTNKDTGNTDQIVNMVCKLLKTLYSKSEVTFGFDYILENTLEIKPNQIYDIQFAENKIKCVGVTNVTVEGDPAGSGEYTLKKTLSEENSKDSFYNKYRLDVRSYDENGLDAMILEDVLPVKTRGNSSYPVLDVCRVFISTDKRERVEITEGEGVDQYSIDPAGSVLKYTFPEDGQATRAILEVETMLTPAAMMSMTGGSLDFTNSARLKKPGEPTAVVEVEGPKVEKKIMVLEKGGSQSSENPSQINWTINIKAAVKGNPVVYMVDALDPKSHDYIEGSKVEVYRGDNRIAEFEIITGSAPGNGTFETVGVRDLIGINQSGKAVVYQTGPDERILAMDISQYLKASGDGPEEQSLRICYSTQIASGAGSGAADTDGTVQLSLSNKVDLRWEDYSGGMGVGADTSFDFSIDKGTDISLKDVSKRAASYDESSQMQTWLFDVNMLKNELGDLVIEDSLNEQQLFPNTISCYVTNSFGTSGHFTTGMLIPQKQNESSPYPYYVMGVDRRSIQIFLGDITAKDSFVLALDTKMSGQVTSQQSAAVQLANEAKIYDQAAPDKAKQLSSTTTVPNTLITKTAVGNYDYTNNEMHWKVEVNPNNLVIENAEITDTLPQYMTIDTSHLKLKEATYGGISVVDQVKWTLEKEGEQDVFKLTANSASGNTTLEKKLILEFTTQLKEEYRKLVYTQNENSAMYKDVAEDGNLTTSFTNHVNLTGKITDATKTEGYLVNAGSSADNTITSKPLEKTAEYLNGGIIQWTAVINQLKGDLSEKILTDTFIDELEFNETKGSYGLYKASVTPEGTVTVADSIPIADAAVYNESNGSLTVDFSKLQADQQKDTYILKFQTYINANKIEYSKLTNTLELTDGQGHKLSSNTASPSKSGSFNEQEYVTAANAPILMIEKVSSNGTELKLSDVGFTIYQYDNSSTSDPWVDKKVKPTRQNGRMVFVNFERGKLYKISETSAPTGYTAGADHFIYWLDQNGSAAVAGLSELTPGQKKYTTEVPVGIFFRQIRIENEPGTGGNIQFTKADSEGDALSGVSFTLKRVDVLKKEWSAVSNADGTVVFDKVDPGEYILTETVTPDGYTKPGSTWKVEKTGTTYAITGDNVSGNQGSYVICNQLAKASLTIIKKDSRDNDYKMSGVEFTLTGKDYEGNLLGNGAGISATTDSAGKLTFADIPVGGQGEAYTLTEKVPAGYRIPESDPVLTYEVSVTADGNSAKLTLKDSQGKEIDVTAKESAFSATIENDPVTGTIVFTKTGSNSSDSGKVNLEGARFGLYLPGGTQIAADSNGKEAVTVSGADGAVRFADIYFGEYIIREIEAPQGYCLSSGAVTVTRKDIVERKSIEAGGKTFTHTLTADEAGKLNNIAIGANVTIRKTDQNQGLLSGVEFKVERYGDASTPKPSGTDYVPYPSSGAGQFRTDAKGEADLGRLIFGTYRITETGQSADVIDTVQKVSYLTVTGSSTSLGNTVLVQSCEHDPESNPNAVKVPLKMEAASYIYPIENRLKYGILQINKVAGARNSDSRYEVAYAEDGKTPIPVSGAKFEIFKESQVSAVGTEYEINEKEEPYLTLITNTDGHFDVEETGESAGKYTDCGSNKGEQKHLIIGNYFIREQSAPDGFTADHKLYPFTASWDESGNRAASVWIGNEGMGQESYFINEMYYAPVSLVKTDSADHNNKLSGAQFVVYNRKDDGFAAAVAVLKETDADQNKGMYHITADAPEDMTLTAKNAQGISYLKDNKDGTFSLLSGEYYVTETISPQGYAPLKDGDGTLQKIPFKVSSTSEIFISNTGNASDKIFINTLGTQNLTIHKLVDPGNEKIPATDTQKGLEGFRFTLSGTPVTGSFTTKTEETDSTGKAVFPHIPYGEYTLTEEERTDGRAGNYVLAAATTLIVSADAITQAGDGETLAFDVDSYSLRISNKLKRGTIKGLKTGAGGNSSCSLAEVVFGLYTDAQAKQAVLNEDGKPASAVTDQNGVFLFTGIPYGSYYLKEMSTGAEYSLSTEVRQVILTGDTDNVEIELAQPWINQVLKAKVELYKRDSVDIAQPLSEAEFGIYSSSKLTEQIAWLIEKGNTGTYLLTDERDGEKLAAVTGESGLPCYVEDALTGYLTAGTYYLTELKAPDYYQPDNGIYEFTVDQAADTEGIIRVFNESVQGVPDRIFTNRRITSDVIFDVIYKAPHVDGEEDSVYGVGNAEFAVYTEYNNDSDNKPYEVTDENGGRKPLIIQSAEGSASGQPGKVEIKDLPPGTYYIKQTVKQDYFKKHVVIYQIVTDGNRSETIITQKDGSEPLKEIEFIPEDAVIGTNLDIELRGNDGSLLANAEFRVYRNGLFIGTYRTNGSGRARMRAILPGTYKISQISSAGGFLPDQIEKNIEIALGEDKQLPVVNYRPQNNDTDNNHTGGTDGSASAASAVRQHVDAAAVVPAINISAGSDTGDKGAPVLDRLPATGGMMREFALLLTGLAFIALGFRLSAGGRKEKKPKKLRCRPDRTDDNLVASGSTEGGDKS